jgi:hypothetical protein
MAVDFEKVQKAFTDLNIWFKINNDESITLADMPELIRLRWSYFRDNWNFISQRYASAVSTYRDPDKLANEIVIFTDFINSQRNSKVKKNPFDSSDILYRFYSIFDNTPVDSVALTFDERNTVNNKTRTIRSFTRRDFLNIRSQFQAERDAIADRVGASDPDYNKSFSRSSQTARVDIKNKDVNKMYEIQQTIKAVDFILANSFSLESAVIDPFALARANANNNEINIGTYSSGTLTKLNYKEDLQALAKRTLGDPDKWIDIAIANGLKAPYIDEVGEKIPLISNANGNQINIAQISNDSFNIDKMFIGQIVLLKSNTQTFPEQRTILNIKEIPISGEIVIDLSGERDLQRYQIPDDAHIRIYKPNTVNSSFYILIPSTEPLGEFDKKETPWFLKGDDAVAKRQRVDLNINTDGDINLNSTGDLQLSYSLDNAIQAIKLKLMIELGELRRHSDFGLVNIYGQTNNNVEDVRSSLVNSISTSIDEDPRFDGIEDLNIVYNNSLDKNAPSYFSITIVVRLAGTDNLVPITFTVNT